MIVEHDLFKLIVIALAAYRLQRVISTDDWPPSVAFRDWLAARTGLDSGWSQWARCPWCAGFHAALVVYAAVEFGGVWGLRAAVVLAVAALVGLIAERQEREDS